MMNVNKNIRIAVIVGLLMVVGVSAGYLYGYEKGNFNGYYMATDQAKAMQEEAKKQAALEAAKAVNPFESENLFEKSPINPFDDIETNPYK